MLNKEVRDFYIYFYATLKHPFQQRAEQKIDKEELELALDFLEEVIETKVSEERLQELEPRFNSAFESYINLPRTQIGALCNSIEKLASLIDPFLKKLAYNFYPQKKISKGNKSISLWQASDFADILDELQISKIDLKRSDENFWAQQPCDQAILRIAFVTRHKGVHESHQYSLQELERIAYATIGSYIVICLNVMRDPSIRGMFKEKIDERHFIVLLKGKTEAFDTTGSLLSENEHLSIYRYRANIRPTHEEARFLFINYLASRGPVFFWLGKYDKNLKIKWASESLKTQDEVIRRNAVHYLAENGKRLDLKEIAEFFSDYEFKVELAKYIVAFARNSDINLLMHLYRSKAEEVADAAFEMLCRLVRRENSSVLQKLGMSQSLSKQYLFQNLIRKIAKKKKLSHYRRFGIVKDKLRQMIMLYCLGEVGEKCDIVLIESWFNVRRRSRALQYASWYSIGRIASKIGDTDLVYELLKKQNKDIRIAVLESVTREGIGARFDYLFKSQDISEDLKCDVISRISIQEDLTLIKNYLKQVELDNNARRIVLTICRHGGAKEFDFLIDSFSKNPSKIEFWNHVKVASEISKLCDYKALPLLKQMISSPEFWKYFGKERSKVNPIAVRNFENLPLIKRIISVAFCKVATKKEIPILRKLLKHDYKWIGLNASLAISRVSDEKDLDWLVQEGRSSQDDTEQENIITAVCLLDKRLYENNI